MAMDYNKHGGLSAVRDSLQDLAPDYASVHKADPDLVHHHAVEHFDKMHGAEFAAYSPGYAKCPKCGSSMKSHKASSSNPHWYGCTNDSCGHKYVGWDKQKGIGPGNATDEYDKSMRPKR